MKTASIACCLAAVAGSLALPAAHAQNSNRVDAAFEAFWAAGSPDRSREARRRDRQIRRCV